MVTFSELTRPEGLRDMVYPLETGGTQRSGFQGAHLIGEKFWTDKLGDLANLLNEPGSDAIGPNGL